MEKNNKKISVVIPTFNEEKRIGRCLESVVKQNFPKKQIEILVVDDVSTDKTTQIAKKHGAKILKNGSKNIEKGKSIGVAHASGQFILFIDADNELLTNNWIKDALEIFRKHTEIVGVQSYAFKYYKDDPIANRYCSLFGINDPMAFYLGKRGQLMATEKKWIYPKTLIKEYKKYFLCEFTEENLPTIGSQGYMVKKSLLKKTNWKPYLFHLDSAYELVEKGHNRFVFLKHEIKHDYVESVVGMIKKLRRNINLYLELEDKRHYKYDLTPMRLFKTIIIMATFVVPFYDSLKNYIKKRDVAWFLHPFLSFAVVLLYGFSVIEFKLKNL